MPYVLNLQITSFTEDFRGYSSARFIFDEGSELPNSLRHDANMKSAASKSAARLGRFDPLPPELAARVVKAFKFQEIRNKREDFVIIGLNYILSDDAKNILEKIEPGVHQFLPLQAHTRTKRMKLPNGDIYWLMIVPVQLECVDHIRSKLIPDRSGNLMWKYPDRSPDKWDNRTTLFLDRDVIAGHHLWYGGGGGHMEKTLFCSDELKQAWQDADMQPITFIPVEVY